MGDFLWGLLDDETKIKYDVDIRGKGPYFEADIEQMNHFFGFLNKTK
jgi:hypothetical protein